MCFQRKLLAMNTEIQRALRLEKKIIWELSWRFPLQQFIKDREILQKCTGVQESSTWLHGTEGRAQVWASTGRIGRKTKQTTDISMGWTARMRSGRRKMDLWPWPWRGRVDLRRDRSDLPGPGQSSTTEAGAGCTWGVCMPRAHLIPTPHPFSQSRESIPPSATVLSSEQASSHGNGSSYRDSVPSACSFASVVQGSTLKCHLSGENFVVTCLSLFVGFVDVFLGLVGCGLRLKHLLEWLRVSGVVDLISFWSRIVLNRKNSG